MNKKLEDLKDGKCIVVLKSPQEIYEKEGSYDSKFNVVFCCTPSHHKTIGYKQ